MRKQYTEVLKTFFHKEVYGRRKAMGCRGYAKIDNGYICCSALTLALYLMYICEDPLLFLQELRHAIENSNEEAA